ncbi:hypothetical protein [Caldinitratiruptor microaerophilus]|uniref:Uncharacterized protein n=1 Tax=Caldinitratiruptor microaerophilus TaxID=671077 RepID=A0AA35CJK2_9FIRM|nr:hypothetical protein [Caldinitratiruptor microaerophilus]BDG60392.1 hypothetical protein caldi_14820 [Caldinitratiruptor microaerophilus]
MEETVKLLRSILIRLGQALAQADDHGTGTTGREGRTGPAAERPGEPGAQADQPADPVAAPRERLEWLARRLYEFEQWGKEAEQRLARLEERVDQLERRLEVLAASTPVFPAEVHECPGRLDRRFVRVVRTWMEDHAAMVRLKWREN